MNANIKYLKDENGTIFSPVTSTKSVYHNNNSLDKIIDGVLLFDGSTHNNITLSQSVANFKYIEVMYSYMNVFATSKLYSPNNKAICLVIICTISEYSALRIQYKTMLCKDKTLTAQTFGYYTKNSVTEEINTTENSIIVEQVYGYY